MIQSSLFFKQILQLFRQSWLLLIIATVAYVQGHFSVVVSASAVFLIFLLLNAIILFFRTRTEELLKEE